MDKTTVILVRHCEAQGNIDRIFQGHWNGKITENGKTQLEHLAKRMQQHPFHHLYSSPLSRTVSTARACNMYYGLPIHIINDVIEINGGDWEGKEFASFPEIFPNEAKLWVEKPWDFVAPGGESMQSVYDRMRDTVLMLVRRHQGERICVVSHGCAIRNFLCYAKGWDLTHINEIQWCDNTAISIVEFDHSFHPQLVQLNDSSHLPYEKATLMKQSWWKKENLDSLRFGE